jgi:hypothetical protein
MSDMPMPSFDDRALRSAMAAYLDAARRLDELSSLGGEAREVIDLAETKAIAGMALRNRLTEAGWTPPASPRLSGSTPQRLSV